MGGQREGARLRNLPPIHDVAVDAEIEIVVEERLRYTHMCIFTHPHTYAHTRTRTHPHAYPRARTRVHAHAHARAHITRTYYQYFSKDTNDDGNDNEGK